MVKYILLVSSLMFLGACSLMPEKTEVKNDAPKGEVTVTAPSTVSASSLAYVDYTLHEGTADGKILDTSRKADAEKSGLVQTGRTYEPFQVLMSGNNTIPGFKNGLMGMKKGEKKTFEVLPKDGYGEATETITLPDYQIKPIFSKTIDKTIFSDVLTQTVQRSVLGEEGKTIKVGEYLSGATDTKVRVTKIDGDNITVEMQNTSQPFYGKKLAVGLKAEKEDALFTIKAISGTGVTVEVVNKSSPFYEKKVEVGAIGTVKTPFQVMSIDGKRALLSGDVTISALTEDTVTLTIANSHPLAGKTLYFDVEVVDIK